MTATKSNNTTSKHPTRFPSAVEDNYRGAATSAQASLRARNVSMSVSKTWGQQSVLLCVRDISGGEGPGASASPPPPSSSSSCKNPMVETTAKDELRLEKMRTKLGSRIPKAGGVWEGVDTVRAKLASRLGVSGVTAVPGPSSRMEVDEEDHEDAARKEQSPPAADMPWSLRTRRGSYSRPAGPSPSATNAAGSAPCTLHAADADAGRRHQRRPLFSVTLPKVEIECDVLALTGRRAARRPRTRPRALKRQLDMLFPGYYLSEAAAESYDVLDPEPPPAEPVPDAY